MLFIFGVLVILGIGTIIRNLIDIRKQNDKIIELLDTMLIEDVNLDEEQ